MMLQLQLKCLRVLVDPGEPIRDAIEERHGGVRRAVILSGGMTLDEDYFHFENDREEQLSRVENAFRYGSIREMEKLMILNRLKDNDENRTRSAETLDISVRTLRNKLNEYNVPKKILMRTEELTGVPT